MNIDIKYYGNEIEFFDKGIKTFYGSYTISWFKHKKELLDQKGQLICKLSSKVNFSGIKHILNFNTYSLELKGGFAKNYYECNIDNDYYKIVIHKGYKTSFFLNDVQIGYYLKESSITFSYQKIKLISNSNINKTLIFSIISALELNSDSDDGLSLDLGNIGKEYKSFDKNWKPII